MVCEEEIGRTPRTGVPSGGPHCRAWSNIPVGEAVAIGTAAPST
jgi:hypothetical protein